MMLDGEQAENFNEMTRQTIARYIARYNTDQLLDLLGHIIITEREGDTAPR